MTNYRYGTYPRSQRIALLAILAVVMAVTVFLSLGAAPALSPGLSSAAAKIRAEEVRLEAKNFRAPPESFAFDPNLVSSNELQRLGLSKKQATSWLKFRGKSTSRFKQPEDIGKLYVLSEEEKARLIPLAFVIPTEGRARPQVQSFAFDPNDVSARDLQRLGLSTKQAAGFVRYRSKAKYGRAFKKPDDIRRLGTLSDEQKDHLVSLAEIPPEEKIEIVRQRFTFDPNTISPDSLSLLGFPKWQTNSFAKYRGDRKTTFRRPTDLRRVGALDSALVEEIIPLIVLAPLPDFDPASAAEGAPKTYDYTPKPPPPAAASFDVNSASPQAWQRLPGIGKYRASKIVRYRQKFGGFYSIEQISETPDLPDSTFQLIQPFLKVGPILSTIAINRASYNDLKRHPFISSNVANAVVKNREKFGRFDGPEDLKRIRLITQKNLPTLLPYLSFE